MKEQFEKEYDALKNGAALQLRPDAGLLLLSGEDRSDFLQRMTTNDIKRLKAGQSVVTVLTSPIARTLFVFTVVCRENELWLLPARDETTNLERHLRGNIFFMDKVTLRNLSSDWKRARLMGPNSGTVLSALGLQPSRMDDQWQESPTVAAIYQQKYDLPGYELLISAAHEADVLKQIEEAGATMLSAESAYNTRRIELMRPLPGSELTSDYTPLESGLTWACAENKGCYTGQEIIARQITYDKVTKSLTLLSSAQPLPVGATLTVDGKDAGIITSALSETGSTLALAIVKRPFHTPNSILMVDGITTTVVELEA